MTIKIKITGDGPTAAWLGLTPAYNGKYMVTTFYAGEERANDLLLTPAELVRMADSIVRELTPIVVPAQRGIPAQAA
ncbi:MAG TPA: hypothetical protein VGF34_09225 [Stellaceae bacterium]|jgi:hypothetical protein